MSNEVEEMFARTERLMLRPAWKEDAGMIAALVQSERKVRDLFHASAGCHFAQPCALSACTHGSELPRLLVLRRTDGAPELIGMVGLERDPSGAAELVCWVARPHRGKGYGTESARALMNMAREGLRLKRVVARRHRDGASARLLARLGFHEGELAFAVEAGNEAVSAPPLQAEAA